MTGDASVTLRGVNRLKSRMKAIHADFYAIRSKGFAAVACASDRNVFCGMFATVEKSYDRYLALYDEAIDYSEQHNLDPPFPAQEDEQLLKQFKSFYYDIQGYNIQVMAIMTPVNPNPAPLSQTLRSSLDVGELLPRLSRNILPKIPIKHFDGKLNEWETFKQLFESLIINEATLTNSERFHYLVSYLKGPAYDVIKSIPVVEENFEQAWHALLKVFDDKRKMACSYLDTLLNFKPAQGKPNAASLQAFLSQVMESITSLENLKIPDFAHYILCELALRGLDPVTREAFELHNIGNTYPTSANLKTYVQNRAQVLRITSEAPKQVENLKPASQPRKSPNRYAPKDYTTSVLMAHGSTDKSGTSKTCYLCKADHIISACSKFKSATPSERLNLLKHFPGCRNCLHPQHKTKDCKSLHCCRECKKRHHSDLHLPTEDRALNNTASSGSTPSTSFSGASTAGSSGVLLGTAVVRIKDANGGHQTFRGVLDPGSQFTFVTDECAKKLCKSTRPFNGAISGVNNAPLKNVKGKTSITLLPRYNSNPLETEAVVVPAITPFLPQKSLVSSMWDDYLSYDLSDPDFTKPGPIHFLIGADVYPDIVTGTPVIIHEDGPRLIRTVFGYTVMGKFHSENTAPDQRALGLFTHNDITSLIERFWEIEEPVPCSSVPPEEEECDRHFLETHRRTEDGRYIVSLPFKSNPPNVTPNQRQVFNRLYSLESKLAKDPHLREDYGKFMSEYEELGHMSAATSPPSYIIPHHPVYKVNGDERKIRVVFDASFRSTTTSLNDLLHTGPKLQADISAILLNFRRYQYAFSCDIVKMFRQIQIEPKDRRFQQIAWRADPSQPVQLYELNTVTYGLRSSPYLANRVIKQHAINYKDAYPEASEILMHNVYVDDIVGGSDSPEQLLNLKHQLIELLQHGGFELSKWCSNYPPILADDTCGQQPVEFCAEDKLATKILGMRWDPQSDSFSYEVSEPPAGFTKRSILSAIARLFDPLGYLSPVIFFAKCVMQSTWQHKLGWDEEVPQDIKALWNRFLTELPDLTAIRIPRAFPKTDTAYQLLCFSDASERGYGAVVYLRSTQGEEVSVTLVKSKTRLAPLKTLTVPRLELSGALLLSQLLKSLNHLIQDLYITQIYCFTDSMIVLSWLSTLPHLLQTFVANRVQQVLSVTQLEWWHHIRGSENPADASSRGIWPSLLQHHQLWWNGPFWCHNPISDWPLTTETPAIDVPELKHTNLSLVMVTTSPDLVNYAARHSSFTHLIRVMAYVKRFIFNARIPKRMKKHRTSGPVSSVEFKHANHHYIKLLQHFYFSEVFTTTNFNLLPTELRRLNVFVDPEGIVRVGGRLNNAPLTEEQKHPILLPARSHYTNLIVDYHHRINHHVGPSALLAILRQQYWIPRVKSLLRFLKHRCVVCTRFSKTSVAPFMGNLPKSRFAGVRPFLITGVDFAGPFLYRESVGRNPKHLKAYLCLFICMSSRALHLEVATSLSVEGFLDAFDRFTARRGLPTQMLSDGGTNFRGASRYIEDIMQWHNSSENHDAINRHTSHLGIEWFFNPPASPHFDGGWEVSVRCVKDLFYKAFGNQPFTLPELFTIFTKIEGILNSRPLQPVSNSPEDLEPLTPGHFLVGQPLNALPESDLSEVPQNRLNRWQLIRERIQYFWNRWREEYVRGLQVRTKWSKMAANLKVGDLVLISDTAVSPTLWPMARILQVHPGADSVVRVVTLKTARGIYKRPAVKLIPLQLEPL